MSEQEQTPEKTMSGPRKRGAYEVGKKYPSQARTKPSSYLNTNDLEIPEDVARDFGKAGFHLRWVRFIFPGTVNEIDYRNIGRRIQQGYVPVSIDEIPVMAISSFKRDIEIIGMDNGSFKNVIVKGDLALMKVPMTNVAERQTEMRNVTKAQLQAVNRQARSNNLANESRSESRVYHQRNRGSDEAKYVDFQQD